MLSKKFDVIVIGLGAIGSAALYQLSKRGLSILGIDRFDPPHSLGSSHGETRITRLAVGESPEYVPIVMRSHELWKTIEIESNTQIFTSCGGILMDSGKSPWSKHGSDGFFKRTVDFAKAFGIAHQLLNAKELRERYPNFRLEANASGYFEPTAGYLKPEVAIRAQLDLAKRNGAKILTNSPVTTVSRSSENEIEVNVGGVKFYTEKVINCSGGWIKDFLPRAEEEKLKICRQILHWIEIEDKDWENSPVFMWGIGADPEDFIYGFPSLDGKSIKMATESFFEVSHPDLIEREVSIEEQQKFWKEKVENRVSGLKNNFLKSTVCFYTVTEDARFMVKQNPEIANEWWVSACSGHGFKHSAALGEYLADCVTEKPTRFKFD
ncbi:sarcosine oxidase [Algoriphagus iocasae]|uniref:Sarcosine oxidase n=1 Tax=Algoriphagus iocasae TaxID=1836499 RepID=A0A841ME06_9BACT|nr:N-methyl-L-tryptophan oxidase [Algoriphagus iocasae]MBB6326302.1 sarcosine oxidase [Algoriphagus iocasae]